MDKVESMNERAYEKDERFRRYVNKYCEHRGITITEALRHELVSQVRQKCEEGNGIAIAEATTYLKMLNELGKNGSAAADAFAAGTEHIKAGGLTMAEAMESGWGLTDVLSILDEQAYETGTSISNIFGSAGAANTAFDKQRGQDNV